MINKIPETLINTGLSGFFFAREYKLKSINTDCKYALNY